MATPRFKEQEHLEPFLKYLLPLCRNLEEDEEVVVYRTQHNIPMSEYDETPLYLRDNKNYGRRVRRKLTPEEVAEMDEAEIRRIIGKMGLSCNSTVKAAWDSFIKGYRERVEAGDSPEELEKWVIKRGEYICKYIITIKAGLLTEWKNNHSNLYLYEGVKMEMHRDKTFEPVRIEYENYGEYEEKE